MPLGSVHKLFWLFAVFVACSCASQTEPDTPSACSANAICRETGKLEIYGPYPAAGALFFDAKLVFSTGDCVPVLLPTSADRKRWHGKRVEAVGVALERIATELPVVVTSYRGRWLPALSSCAASNIVLYVNSVRER
jgi:hypothetical protein